jgi:hypothetical protein
MKNATRVELHVQTTTIKIQIRTMLKPLVKPPIINTVLRKAVGCCHWFHRPLPYWYSDITRNASRATPAGFVPSRFLEIRPSSFHQPPPSSSSASSIMDYPLRGEAELRQSLVVAGDGAGGEQQQQQRQQQYDYEKQLQQEEESSTAFLTLEIKAPSALPEGYPLRVQHGGIKLVVPVPAGGVVANQVFRVVVPKPTAAANNNKRPEEGSSAPFVGTAGSTTTTTGTTGPVGHWKDGFLDIFSYGAFHPHAVTSLACSLCKWLCGLSTTILSVFLFGA